MNALRRLTAVAVAAVGFAPALRAQIPGAPLFSNPRFATGFRIHADLAQPTGSNVVAGTNQTVVEGGVGFVLGPIGIDANVGALSSDLKNAQQCQANPSTCNTKASVSGSALGQIKIMGGAEDPGRVSIFGGASYTLTAAQAAGLTAAQQAALGVDTSHYLTIPIGVAIGYHIPLGLLSVNLWGAPRYVLINQLNCGSTCNNTNMFRWAVGADVPIFKILSVRAAYDSGSKNGVTTSFWGVGASVGLGGMR